MTNRAAITSTKAIGWGVTRLLADGIGYADVAAVYDASRMGWNVEVQHTNITDPENLERVVNEFRMMEEL